MKFYVTDVNSKKNVEFEANSFEEARKWVVDNITDPYMRYIGMVDIGFGDWHKYEKESKDE